MKAHCPFKLVGRIGELFGINGRLCCRRHIVETRFAAPRTMVNAFNIADADTYLMASIAQPARQREERRNVTFRTQRLDADTHGVIL